MFPLSFTGTAGDYFRIWIANIALTLLTLGIYSAWAKVRKDASAGAARAGEYARH